MNERNDKTEAGGPKPVKLLISFEVFLTLHNKYQPSGAGGTRSPPATPHRVPVGPKMADGVWKGVYPWVLGRSRQLSLNKFFDPSTPSMRKVDDGEEKQK